METIAKLFKIDMKIFTITKAKIKNNQYTFNGVAKELIKVLLKVLIITQWISIPKI